MCRIHSHFLLALLVSFCLFACKESEVDNEPENSSRPNIIYILAGDLGYAEIGAYGQSRIETPNLDALAANGMVFSQHYASAPVCAPDRYMLLTGKHSGHAFIRGNHEWGTRGDVWNAKAMARDSTLEGQYPMPDSTITIAAKLKKAGYTTAMYGKWGLGAPHTNSIPNKMGFDDFFGINCQRLAHNYYPLHLYKNENRYYLKNDTILAHSKFPVELDPDDAANYKAYTSREYAPEVMFGGLTDFVDKNAGNPFFIYWATPIPHLALQAPEKWVDHYRKKFGDEEPYSGNKGYLPNQYPKATYAAMISYLDENIGKMVTQLKEKGIYENTIIIFSSDNGPAYNGGTASGWFDSAKPFSSDYGWGKGFVHEGGIRVPMIASWPAKIVPGSKTTHISAQYDVFATLSDIAGLPVGDTDGISFLPTLTGEGQQMEHPFLYWEFPEYQGQLAVRMGKWKVVYKDLKKQDSLTGPLVYNLEEDPGEKVNIAIEFPEIVQKANQIIKEEHQTPEVKRFIIPSLEKFTVN